MEVSPDFITVNNLVFSSKVKVRNPEYFWSSPLVLHLVTDAILEESMKYKVNQRCTKRTEEALSGQSSGPFWPPPPPPPPADITSICPWWEENREQVWAGPVLRQSQPLRHKSHQALLIHPSIPRHHTSMQFIYHYTTTRLRSARWWQPFCVWKHNRHRSLTWNRSVLVSWLCYWIHSVW